MPVGLYATIEDVRDRGTIVLTCLPRKFAEFAKQRGYVGGGGSCPSGLMPIGKPILALPGDIISVTGSDLRLNGAVIPNSAPLAVDRHGRRLPRLPAGRYVVGLREYWLISQHSPFSFDSRYFGAIEADDTRVAVRLIWAPLR